MSGIVGIVSTDGAPVDRRLLERMTLGLRFRGPDRQQTWSEGGAGFGHALLATTAQAAHERQPCTVDGSAWIVADARIDGRDDLIAKLAPGDPRDLQPATDAELILHAYRKWGGECVRHLLGDFAFAIWNARERTLFAARDHFGAKPFYYARAGRDFVFSNTLDSVRMHPDVSDALNELAIADYLLFYFNQDLATTIYADVRRLPPAHTLTMRAGHEPAISRYWTLESGPEIRYRRSGDYVEHFNALFRTAVNDRLRTNKVGVLMTGGLDSSSVAATAKGLLAGETPFDLRAYTIVFDRLIRDEERRYAGIVASSLNIPIQFVPAENYRLFRGWTGQSWHPPEPVDEPQLTMYADLDRTMAANCRVVLTGSDGDTVLTEWPLLHFNRLAKQRRFGGMAVDLWHGLRTQRQLPRLGWRTAFRERNRKDRTAIAPMPAWIDPDFARRLDLETRWREVNAPARAPIPHRRRASIVLSSPIWTYFFESHDPGITGVPLEKRHPFADLRLVDYLLAIPAYPWSDAKTLLRAAMTGVLPDSILNRPKTTLSGDPILERLKGEHAPWFDTFESVPELDRYVNRRAIPPVTGASAREDSAHHLRPFTLNEWMRRRITGQTTTEEQYGENNSVA